MDIQPAKGPQNLPSILISFSDKNKEIIELENITSLVVIVKNLPYNATESSIHEFFNLRNRIKKIDMFCRFQNKFKGRCYIEFTDIEAVQSAYLLSGHPMNGRFIKIEIAPDSYKEDITQMFKKYPTEFSENCLSNDITPDQIQSESDLVRNPQQNYSTNIHLGTNDMQQDTQRCYDESEEFYRCYPQYDYPSPSPPTAKEIYQNSFDFSNPNDYHYQKGSFSLIQKTIDENQFNCNYQLPDDHYNHYSSANFMRSNQD